MKDIRLVALDLDGTVFNDKKEITPRTLAAIRAACARGVAVLPATGRTASGIPAAFTSIPGVRDALRGTSALAALAAACAVGRGMAVLLMYRQRYAREEGLGNLFIGKITLRQSLITMGIALALATLLLGVNGLRAALITLVLVWALGQALKRTLGGQTGDTLGAAIELGEVIFLLALL